MSQQSNKQLLIKAARQMDWMQVVLNQGPPCFHLEGEKFCGRAQRWEGHGLPGFHRYIPLHELIEEATHV